MGVKVKFNAPKKAWYVYVNHNKKRISKAFGSNEKAARDAAREIAKSIKLGELSLDKKAECPTVQEFGEQWLDGNTTRKVSTMRHYRYHATRHIFPVLGSLVLDQVTRADVRKLIAALPDFGISRGTSQFAFAVFAGLMTAALDAGYVTSNPTHGLRREIAAPDDESELDQAQALTQEQVEALLAGIRNVKRRDCKTVSGETLYEFFLTQARTGMRIGEVAALQWAAIDFDKRRIAVRRTLTDYNKFTTPKSNRIRYVDMSEQLAETLKRRKARSQADPLALVFVNDKGKVLDTKNIRGRVFSPVAKMLGYGYITPHILRHSFASQLLNAGTPIHYVQEQLGHSTPTITLNTYGHFLPTAANAAVNKLDAQAAHPARILHLASSRVKSA